MLLRYAGLFIILTLIALAFWTIFLRDAAKVSKIPAENEHSPKAKALGIKSVRLLDRLNTDNTLIGNDKWREEMQDLLKEWYGK